ncbi:MAG TPA: hypothetical protein VGE01_10180, partial [Fimbriimonas sp.]
VELANRLLLGEEETTIGIKYESTEDGRQAALHERSTVAGSGDPKKDAERKAFLTKKGFGYLDKPNEPHTSEEELGVTSLPLTDEEDGKATLK